jgi:hypothetical protein
LDESVRADTMVSYLYDNPFVFDKNDTVILVVSIFGKEPEPVGDYYIIGLYRNGILLNDTIDEYITIHDESYGINEEELMSLYFNENNTAGDTVELEIRSIHLEYYDFIKGLNMISEGSYPFGFSAPPANATGNIKGGNALGYFITSSVTRIGSYVQTPETDQ